jgi:hypothetical protein
MTVKPSRVNIVKRALKNPCARNRAFKGAKAALVAGRVIEAENFANAEPGIRRPAQEMPTDQRALFFAMRRRAGWAAGQSRLRKKRRLRPVRRLWRRYGGSY